MRRLARMGLLTATVMLVVGTTSTGQPAAKPGPEHEKFKQMEGTWDATVKSQGGESKGTMTYKLGLGGLWLMEHFKGQFGDIKFEGVGLTTYDPAKKKYISVWADSMSTNPMVSEGTMDKAGKVMTMAGEMIHEGKTMKVRMVSEMKDANNMTFTMFTPGPDNKDIEMMKITYKRKAK